MGAVLTLHRWPEPTPAQLSVATPAPGYAWVPPGAAGGGQLMSTQAMRISSQRRAPTAGVLSPSTSWALSLHWTGYYTGSFRKRCMTVTPCRAGRPSGAGEWTLNGGCSINASQPSSCRAFTISRSTFCRQDMCTAATAWRCRQDCTGRPSKSVEHCTFCSHLVHPALRDLVRPVAQFSRVQVGVVQGQHRFVGYQVGINQGMIPAKQVQALTGLSKCREWCLVETQDGRGSYCSGCLTLTDAGLGKSLSKQKRTFPSAHPGHGNRRAQGPAACCRHPGE